MNILERAYASGMEDVFNNNGFTKKASHNASIVLTRLTKKESLFNFSDYQNNSGLSLTNLILPLLAIGGTGYLAYNAGLHGSRKRSAYSNIKNYLGRSLSAILRNTKAPAIHDYAANTHY